MERCNPSAVTEAPDEPSITKFRTFAKSRLTRYLERIDVQMTDEDEYVDARVCGPSHYFSDAYADSDFQVIDKSANKHKTKSLKGASENRQMVFSAPRVLFLMWLGILINMATERNV